MRALRIYRVLETLVVPRNVRDSRFRREPYRKRKRASTYISPIHAERPTNDAARVKEGCGGVGRQAREGGRGERCAAGTKKRKKKKKKKVEEKEKKRGKRGKSGPRATTYLRSAYYQLWDIALERSKEKNKKNTAVHTHAFSHTRIYDVLARSFCARAHIHLSCGAYVQGYILINARIRLVIRRSVCK